MSPRTLVVLAAAAAISCSREATPPAPGTTPSGAGSSPTAPASGGELKAGDVAPAFSMPGSDGKTHDLKDHLGKEAVVVAWFPKAFTGGCTAECKSLGESGGELKKLEVAYYAASIDPAETNKKFAESLALDYAILSDPEKAVAKAYGVLGVGGMYAQRWTFYIGKDGKILHVDRDVSPKSHGNDVAAKLRELGVPERKL